MGEKIDQVIEYLNRRKHEIIERWIDGMEKEFPDVYDRVQLRKQGEVYFQLIVDMHIPVEKHPVYKHLPGWCKFLIEKDVSIVHMIHSSQIFRNSLMEALLAYPVVREPLSEIVIELCSRIDSFERAVGQFYWDNSRAIIQEKNRKLDELHEDKLNLIGKMTASMAHEIRNPLTSIMGFIKLIRAKLSKESMNMVEGYLDIIEGEFANIQMQITGFLSFSKKRVIEEPVTVLSLKQLIESVLVLANPRLINENIELSWGLPEHLTVRVQKVPIQQVISNLLNNGIDALSEAAAPKRLRLEAREDSARKKVTLFVSNNGPEIPKELQTTLFMPFVTSKSEGTGLGLAICRQIMKKNNGDISFTSTPSETTFILTFERG